MKTHIIWACIAVAALVIGTQFAGKEVVIVDRPVEVVRIIERPVEAPKTRELAVDTAPVGMEVQQPVRAVIATPASPAVDMGRTDAAERHKLHRRYRPFLESLGLSAEQMNRFVDLKLALAEARQDLQAAVEQSGAQGGTPGVEAIRADLTRPMWDEIRQLLGPDGYEAYGDYERTSAVRPTVDDMFRAAAVSVSEQQAEQLTRLIVKNTELYRANPTDIGNRSRINWEAVAREAEGLLSPAQIEVVKARGVFGRSPGYRPRNS